MMQSCHPVRDDFNYRTFGSSSDQSSFNPDTDFKDAYDGGSYYSRNWDQELNDIKELVVDADNSVHPQLVPKCKESREKSPSILLRLQDLYHEEIQKNAHSEVPNCRQTSYLLDKLVKKENFNMIIFTLHPIPDGYSLSFCSESGEVSEGVKYSYKTGEELLDYIDREQLPTGHLEYWEAFFPNLYYDGCVIAQIRDYREGVSNSHVRHVLLRPHTQSLISDVNRLLNVSDQQWSDDERFTVECEVVNNAQRALCLDPSPRVGKRMLKLHQDLHAFDTSSIRSLLHRNSKLVQHRKREHESLATIHSRHPLSDFFAEKRAMRNSSNTSGVGSSCVTETESRVPQRPPSSREILYKLSTLARPLKSLPDSTDFSPQLVEEWILETDHEETNTTNHVKMTILQRPVNLEYIGDLYVDTAYKKGRSNGKSCRFSLGSRTMAERYVKQFTELFTKEGRESARITHLVPGQKPIIIHTSDLFETSRPVSPPNSAAVANNKIVDPVDNQDMNNILQVLSLLINDAMMIRHDS